MAFDAVMVMGKELRTDPDRGRLELAARAAAASATWRAESARFLFALEAQLRGQQRSGSAIVAESWASMGIPDSQMVLRCQTYSTRQEAWLASMLMEELGLNRVAVFTASYHLERTRENFAEHLPLDRFCVLAPESALRIASPAERQHILAGRVSAAALKEERARERRWQQLSVLFSPLSPSSRWRLECFAGRLLRRAGDP